MIMRRALSRLNEARVITKVNTSFNILDEATRDGGVTGHLVRSVASNLRACKMNHQTITSTRMCRKGSAPRSCSYVFLNQDWRKMAYILFAMLRGDETQTKI